jgi:protein O-GlcNAc transferase
MIEKGKDYDAFIYLHSFLSMVESYKYENIEASIRIILKKQSKRTTIAVAKLTINQVLQQAVDAHKAGRSQEAHHLYAAILKIQPKHPDANHNTGLLAVGVGKIELALPFFKAALEANPSIEQFWYSIIDALIKLDKLIDAKVLLNQAKRKGIKGAGFDQIAQKLDNANKVLSVKPDCAEAYYNMGIEFLEQSKLEEAIEAYKKALSIKPNYAEAYNNMGIVLQEQSKLEEAIEAYNKALSIKPEYEDAYNNMGIVLQEQSKPEEAIDAYNKALAIRPDYAEAYNNMGIVFQEQSKPEEAIDAYNKALAIRPDYAGAYYNMGIAFQEQSKLEEAIEAYSKALAIKPDDVDAYNNMGIVLQEQSKLEEAIEAYSKALRVMPDNAGVYYNMGIALKDQGKLEESIDAYNKALEIKPDHEAARTENLHQQSLICNWNSIAKDVNLIPELGTSENHVSPFILLPLEDAPDRHLIRSKIYASANFSQKTLPAKDRPSKKPKRIRIGYFSTDFKEHPVAYLIAKVLEEHNRNQFEVFGYSIHGSSSCLMRQRLEKSFDSFINVQSMSDRDIALQARQDEIDIAIDLNGYTQHARSRIFAYRAAPIQVNYLGYPGSMGSNFIDYIVADRFLIPVENQKYFNEKPLYLPNTYMPTDNSRELSTKKITRSDVGLPDDAFVFCCFNNNYKISPNEFDIWMRLLTKVENSILWLRQPNHSSFINLKNEAQKRKVDPSRLIFANKMPMNEHLARQRFADLFVDTFAFNAHTTAVEALWAGLPVVTKVGLGFASRVAGSLLKAVGLTELITETEKDYEALILALATNPKKLAIIREKLANNLLTQPLFNTELYTRHLENGFHQAYQNYFDGNPPRTIIVAK